MSTEEIFHISQELETFARLDRVLAQKFPSFSRSYFHSLFEKGAVLINGKIAIKRSKIQMGDQINVTFLPAELCSLEPQNIPLNILYEDEHFIAVNKPAGMVVHPAPGHYDQTFVNALLFYCDTLEIEENSLRPGIVHRLDKETSGVLIAAKTKQMQAALTELFSERKMVKEYIAICIGIPKELKAFGKITRHPIKRQEMMFSEEKGKEAETHFEILDRGEKLCVIKAFPKTGRTHQIRVHLKTLGAPILGDDVYGNASFNERYKIKRQLLHAHALRFTHPITQEPIEIVAPLPEDMLEIIKKLQSRIIPK